MVAGGDWGTSPGRWTLDPLLGGFYLLLSVLDNE